MARQQTVYCASLLLLALLRFDVAAALVTGAPSTPRELPAPAPTGPAVPVEPSPVQLQRAEAFCLDVLHGPSLRQRFASRAAAPEIEEAIFRAAFGPLWSSQRSATDEEGDGADTEVDGDEGEADADHLDSTVKKDIARLDALQLLEGSRAAHRRLAHQCADRLARAWSGGIREGIGRRPESGQVYTFLYEADYSELAGSFLDLQKDSAHQREVNIAIAAGAREQGLRVRRYVNRLLVVVGAVLDPEIVLEEGLSLKDLTDWKLAEKRKREGFILTSHDTCLFPHPLEIGKKTRDRRGQGRFPPKGLAVAPVDVSSTNSLGPSASSGLDENWAMWDDWAGRKTFLWKTIVGINGDPGQTRAAAAACPEVDRYREKLSAWFMRSLANIEPRGEASGGRSGLDPQAGVYSSQRENERLLAVVANVQESERELVEPWAPPYALERVDTTSTSRSRSQPAGEVDGAALFDIGGGDRGRERETQTSFYPSATSVEPDSGTGYIGLAMPMVKGPTPMQWGVVDGLTKLHKMDATRWWRQHDRHGYLPDWWFFSRADAEAVCRDLAPALSATADGDDLAPLRPSYALARRRVPLVRDLPARDRLLLLLLLTVRWVVVNHFSWRQQQYDSAMTTSYDEEALAPLIARLKAIGPADLFQAMEWGIVANEAKQWMDAALRTDDRYRSLSWMVFNLGNAAAAAESLQSALLLHVRWRKGAAAAVAVRERICRDHFGIYHKDDLLAVARPATYVPNNSSLYAPGRVRGALLAGGTLQHSGLALVAAHPAVVRTMRRYFASHVLRQDGQGDNWDCISQVVAGAKLFGSAVSGFGTRHSDFDVSFELPQQLLDRSSAASSCVLESLPEVQNWMMGRDPARVIYKSKIGEDLQIDGGGDNFEEDGAAAGYNFWPPSWRDTVLAHHMGRKIGETPSEPLHVRSVADLASGNWFWRKFWLLENVVKRLFETSDGAIMVASQKKRSEEQEVWMSWLSCEIQYDAGNGHVIGKAKVAVRESLLDMEMGVDGDSDRYPRFVVFNLDLNVARFDEVAQTKLRALQSLAVVSPVIRDAARLFLRFAKAKGVTGTLSPKTEFAVMPSFRFVLVFIEFLLARHYVVESEAADAHLQNGANMEDSDLPEVTTTGPARFVRGFALHPRFKQEASGLKQNACVLLSEFVSDFAERIAKPPAGSDAFALPGHSAQALALLLEDRKRMPKRTSGPLRDTLFAVRRNIMTEQLSQSSSYLAHNPWEIGSEGGRGEPEYLRAPVRAAYPIALWTRDLWLSTTEEAAASQTNSAQNPYRFMDPMPRLLPMLCAFHQFLSAKQQTSGADGPGAEGSAGSVAATGCGVPVKRKCARKEQPGGSCSGGGGYFCFGLPSGSPQGSMLSDAARSPSSRAASSPSTPPGVLLRPQAASPGLQMMWQPSSAELPQRSATPVPLGTVPGLSVQGMLLHAGSTNRTHAPTPPPPPGLCEPMIGPPPGLERPQPAEQFWDSVAARGFLPGFGTGHGHDILAGSSQATTPGTGSTFACASDPDRATPESSTGSRGGGRWRQVQRQKSRICQRDLRSATPELTSINQWASTSPATSGQIAVAGLDVTLAGDEIRARASPVPGSSSFSCGGGACSFSRSSSRFSSCEQGGAASSLSSSGFYPGEGGQQPQPRAITPYTYRPGASLAGPSGSYAAGPSAPYECA